VTFLEQAKTGGRNKRKTLLVLCTKIVVKPLTNGLVSKRNGRGTMIWGCNGEKQLGISQRIKIEVAKKKPSMEKKARRENEGGKHESGRGMGSTIIEKKKKKHQKKRIKGKERVIVPEDHKKKKETKRMQFSRRYDSYM